MTITQVSGTMARDLEQSAEKSNNAVVEGSQTFSAMESSWALMRDGDINAMMNQSKVDSEAATETSQKVMNQPSPLSPFLHLKAPDHG